MATPNRMKEIEREHGEPLAKLVPRVLNEAGSIEKAAARLGIATPHLYRWCAKHGIVKTTRQRVGDRTAEVMYVGPESEAERAS